MSQDYSKYAGGGGGGGGGGNAATSSASASNVFGGGSMSEGTLALIGLAVLALVAVVLATRK